MPPIRSVATEFGNCGQRGTYRLFGMVQKWPIWGTGTANPAPPNGKGTGLSGEAEVLGWNRRAVESLKAEQFQPMRMLLPGHEFRRAFAHALGVLASCEGAVIQEEAQQIQIPLAQMAAEEEVICALASNKCTPKVSPSRCPASTKT
ncbi:MAG: hypothetical protein NTX45_29750 [Proteobacteria bacterium]|nr:hypothetical protein [Pseudomonadota bacterium]